MRSLKPIKNEIRKLHLAHEGAKDADRQARLAQEILIQAAALASRKTRVTRTKHKPVALPASQKSGKKRKDREKGR